MAAEMSKKERFAAALDRKPVDRLPVCESIWQDTRKRWGAEGHVGEEEDITSHFDFDMRSAGWIHSLANLDFEPQVLEETEETILVLDGNGATLRRHKLHETTPEHVDFTVKDRETWEEHVRPHLLKVDRRRFSLEGYCQARDLAAEREEFFLWAGVAPFEQMHPICGHENMLMGMALDPEWIMDMVDVLTDLTLRHMEVLFEEGGLPDGFWFFEDMGFKQKPFMSPAMYEQIVQPGHKKLFDWIHERGRKVIVHSCGYVEPLVPGMIEAGMDCLQAMEVKAGMDLPHLFERFGDRIAFCGGLDARLLCNNDRPGLQKEMETKILPVLEGGGGYILHSDHSIPPEVEYETFRFFLEEGRALPERVRSNA